MYPLGNRGHTLKLFTQRAKTNIRNNAFPIRVTEPWNSLPETVIQAKSLNTFKNCLDQFWSNQEILYNFEAPLKTGTGILKLLIDEEDLIIEESQESCYQSQLRYLKVRYYTSIVPECKTPCIQVRFLFLTAWV